MNSSESPLPPLSQRLQALAAEEFKVDNQYASGAYDAYMRAARMLEEDSTYRILVEIKELQESLRSRGMTLMINLSFALGIDKGSPN